jgi:polar amino acid transport system permease protein
VAKLASIASVVSFPELFYPADMARSLTLDSRPVVSAAAIRIVILWSLPCLAGRLERCAAAH